MSCKMTWDYSSQTSPDNPEFYNPKMSRRQQDDKVRIIFLFSNNKSGCVALLEAAQMAEIGTQPLCFASNRWSLSMFCLHPANYGLFSNLSANLCLACCANPANKSGLTTIGSSLLSFYHKIKPARITSLQQKLTRRE